MSFLITTRYHGPTNHKGSRVRATLVSHLADAPRKVSLEDSSSTYGPSEARTWHEIAATRLALRHLNDRKAWRQMNGLRDHKETFKLVGSAETHDGTGYAFLCEWVSA